MMRTTYQSFLTQLRGAMLVDQWYGLRHIYEQHLWDGYAFDDVECVYVRHLREFQPYYDQNKWNYFEIKGATFALREMQ
jgi:hypothetical protein